MRKILFILIFLAQGYLIRAQDPQRFDSEIQKFLIDDKYSPPSKGCILFTGSSSIRFWKSLTSDFNNFCVLNRGFGGSEISDVNYYFKDIVASYEPQMIVLYAGENDLADGKTPEAVLADLKTFLDKVSAISKNIPVIYISAKPSPSRWKLKDTIVKFNNQSQQYCNSRQNVYFVDIYYLMLGNNGKPQSELYIEDSLHMSKLGYELWTNRIHPYLNKYYESNKVNLQKK